MSDNNNGGGNNNPFANAEKLEKIVGFDPAKGVNITKDVFKEVLDEILEDRKQKAKLLAKEQLLKALTLREQMATTRKKFEAEWAKSDKELGKVVNRLYALLNGNPPPEENENKGEPAEANAS